MENIEQEKGEQQSGCIHHWLINSELVGRCCKCGAERQFPNLVKNPIFNEYRPAKATKRRVVPRGIVG